MTAFGKFVVTCSLQAIASTALAQSTGVVNVTMCRDAVAGAIRQLNDRYVFPEMAKKAEAVLNRNMEVKAYDGFNDAAAFAYK